MDFKKVEKIRELCLKNAEDFVKSAKSLNSQNVLHVQYHLATLALEEVGKASMIWMEYISKKKIGESDIETSAMENHIRKLFWALWGQTFGKQIITKEQIDQFRNLATTVHLNRLESLYVSINDNDEPKKKLSKKEVENLINMAEALIGIERSTTTLNPDDLSVDQGDISWFMEATNDSVKRKLIFGGKSMDKLVELGNARNWIHWLKEQFDKEEEEVKKIVDEELKREKPEGKEKDKPKYKIKVKIISESHSLRNKHLEDWNKNMDKIKLTSDDKRTLTCEFLLSKTVPPQALFWVGWGYIRSFVVALNIASRGFFWWHIPKDISKWYEEIEDLERKMKMSVAMNPQLTINWKEAKLVLDKKDLAGTSMLFYFIIKSRGTEMEKALNDYCLGVAFLAKNDIHLRFEFNSFDAFYNAFKKAFLANGDWNGKSDFPEAVKKVFSSTLDDLSSLMECLAIGDEMQKNPHKSPSKQITLTEVVAMKLYCDVYFFMIAKKQADSETDKSGNKKASKS